MTPIHIFTKRGSFYKGAAELIRVNMIRELGIMGLYFEIIRIIFLTLLSLVLMFMVQLQRK